MHFPVRLPDRLRRGLPPGVSLFPRAEKRRWVMSCAPNWRQQVLPSEIVTCDEAVAYVSRHLATTGANPGAEMVRARTVGLTVDECAEKWLKILEADERCAPASLKGHRGFMKNWIRPKFGKRPIGELDLRAVPELRAWLRELRAAHPDGGRTIDHMISTFTRFVDAALAEGWIRAWVPAGDAKSAEWALSAVNVLRHPGVRAEMPKVRRTEPLRLPVPWVQELLDAPTVDLENRARYAMAFCEGMRDGEIAGVQLKRLSRATPPTVKIDQAVALVGAKGKNGHAKPKDPKTEGSRRTLPLHACADAAIDEWVTEGLPRLLGRLPTPEDYLFPRADGQPSRPRSAEQLRADLKAAGLATEIDGQPVEFKSARSSFLTWLDENGVDGRIRKRLAGHLAGDVTEEHYTVRELRQLAGAVATIPLTWTRCAGTVRGPVPGGTVAGGNSANSPMISAEEKGFEPLDDLRRRRFSKPLPSTARPLLPAGRDRPDTAT
jgi:site-specific recombinase XerD